MDVAIEHGDRAEAAQVPEGALGIFRGPSPLRVDRPERDVAEDDDGRAAREPADVLFHPLDLLLAEGPHAFALVFEDVDEPYEMGALAVEALPAPLLDGTFA